MIRIRYYFLLIVIVSIQFSACRDADLDLRPSKSLVVPETLQDLQAILDNIETMNVTPGLSMIASDDVYITPTGWNALNLIQQKNTYIFADDLYQNTSITDWNQPFQQVFYANVVLDALKNYKGVQDAEFRQLWGSALFYRAYAYFHLTQLFTQPFTDESSLRDPGLPFKTSSDINERPGRGTLAETYRHVFNDLNEAEPLLPQRGAFKTRPSKLAVNALKARIYLSMRKYTDAKEYADRVLAVQSTLIDYNTLNPSAARPFPAALPNGNDEVIYYSRVVSYSFFTTLQAGIDAELYKIYQANDLRKVLFFNDRGNNIYSFKGSYRGTSDTFSGLATDEIYLIRAECLVRMGNLSGALQDLNTVLAKRWKGAFTPATAVTTAEGLSLILIERRKELVFRNLRWSDLRRLNMERDFAKEVVHAVGDQTYRLAPGSRKYTFPIPQNEIDASGIDQNPR